MESRGYDKRVFAFFSKGQEVTLVLLAFCSTSQLTCWSLCPTVSLASLNKKLSHLKLISQQEMRDKKLFME